MMQSIKIGNLEAGDFLTLACVLCVIVILSGEGLVDVSVAGVPPATALDFTGSRLPFAYAIADVWCSPIC